MSLDTTRPGEYFVSADLSLLVAQVETITTIGMWTFVIIGGGGGNL